MPGEKPVKEQIEIQIASVSNGELPPLPIPIVFGKFRITDPHLDAMQDVMLKAGWRLADEHNKNEFAKSIQDRMCSTATLFIAPGDEIMFQYAKSGSGDSIDRMNIHLLPVVPGKLMSQIYNEPNGHPKEMPSFFGNIELGLNLDSTKRELERLCTCRFDTAVIFAGEPPYTSFSIPRGVYSYGGGFTDDELEIVGVFYHKPYWEGTSPTRKQMQDYLRKSFGAYTIWERISGIMLELYGIIRSPFVH